MPRVRWLHTAAVVTVSAVVISMAPPHGVAAPDGPPPPPNPPSPTASCNAISPVAFPCVGVGKFADAAAAECRRVGIPDQKCVLPLAHKVTQAARDAYLQSWVHRAAAFQYALGDSLPFRETEWIGTHNSFNSLAHEFTISHADSNQQLSLAQQLDIDVRSLELDLHFMPRIERLGAPGVTVCHGLSAQVGNLGCTVEPVLATVLPEIANWLNTPANSDQVLLILVDNLMTDGQGDAQAVATLERALRRPDGSSLIYHPDLGLRAANGCVPFPLDDSRANVRATGARVVLVSSCVTAWAGTVFDWAGQEVQSGSTSGYQPYPACDATYPPSVYGSSVVRYFEDSTFVSALLNPTRPPNNPAALTPIKVQSMTNCGVNLFGLDQLLPEDGRIQATLWSWAPDEPRAGAGNCTLQGPDSRWVAAQCGDSHPAACQDGSGTWTVTPAVVTFAAAAAACAALGSSFALPRTGDQNSRLHAVAEAVGGAWVAYTF
ncbi:hypothetical protein BST27_11440 [Mycobacterium intermedium]|uniref:Uncharacterized protein n=1 Tax=Mycobacterium intermedium TaxID=28445 RepID=A0A1E3SBQ9_MYCIE|nr:hypothetical protein [Mycobacterium intermedium]MCV6963184.1 hypothetical protein [Mycobacterium intermedium]ODQ99534.1 hypothetical protein BHQ20_16910 [Mycobacterium intermedium]OPE51698.1 hypothetical protein BV508_05435 [Mycobacterium intermedium]ORB06106.1 hypothetical protein BST27_11440 [Mycobacterium intermedium]